MTDTTNHTDSPASRPAGLQPQAETPANRSYAGGDPPTTRDPSRGDAMIPAPQYPKTLNPRALNDPETGQERDPVTKETVGDEGEESPQEWELPEGTTRAVLGDGSTLYTLPDGSQRHVHLGQPDRYIFKHPVHVDRWSAAELADMIRDEVDPNYAQKVHPDHQHLHSIATDVTKELGMEPNALNVNHVAGLLENRVSAPSRMFPKMKYRDAKRRGPDGQPQDYVEERIVENSKAESDLGDGWRDHHWPDETRKMEDPPAAIDPATGAPVGARSEADRQAGKVDRVDDPDARQRHEVAH